MLFDNQLNLDMMFLVPAKAKSLLLDILHYPTRYLVIPNAAIMVITEPISTIPYNIQN